jgi:hypothetical protein
MEWKVVPTKLERVKTIPGEHRRDRVPIPAATRDLNDALQAGWPGFEIGERVPLAEIARAHELVEHPVRQGRVVVTV